jgi:uncharacterized lipoprotein YmbA
MRTLILLVCGLAACSLFKKTTDPTRFFVLTAKEPASAQSPSSSVVVGVAKVELPDYLVRDEMVTRLASNELKISDFDRWGEPLKDSFSRTLLRDLKSQLGDDHVVERPYAPARPQLLLEVDVRRFERIGDQAQLDATWVLRDAATNAEVVRKESILKQPLSGHDTQASVAALSQTLAALANEIAAAVRVR